MMAWRYFDIGSGVFHPFVGTSFNPAGFKMTKPFSKTEQKKGKDRVLRNLFFCETLGCSQVFEDVEAYEAHCLKDQHDDDKRQKKSVMDRVKASYVSLMKISSPNASMNTSTGSIMDTSTDMLWRMQSIQ